MAKAYIASPFFTDEQRDMVKRIASTLRSWGNDVYVPMEHEVPNAWDKSNARWAKETFEADKAAIDNADSVIVINWGMDVDTGTAWECGYACGTGKEVIEVIPKLDNTYSLMMINCTDGIYMPMEIERPGCIDHCVEDILDMIEQK